MLELFERGGVYSYLVAAVTALTWAGAVWRVVRSGRDYRAMSAGGWLMLGGVMTVCLAAASLVPPHASVLMTVYAGLGPPLLLLLGMSGLVVIDGLAAWRNPIPRSPHRVARWAGMALILAGLGLLMEIRAALAIHMGMVDLGSIDQLVESTTGWFELARNGGTVAALLGMALMLEGLWEPYSAADASSTPSMEPTRSE